MDFGVEIQPDGTGVVVPLHHRPVRTIPVPALTAGLGIYTGPVLLCGWSFRNTNTTAGHVEIYDGQDAKGELVGEAQMGSAASDTERTQEPGVLCRNGLYLNPTSGQYTGAVWVRFLDQG